MATLGVGVDVVDVARFALALDRRPRLVGRLFTENEQRDAHQATERLAARFAAKEAVLKSLHVGLGALPWHSIEICREPNGAPRVELHERALEFARASGVASMELSLTHTHTTAAAVVVASSRDDRAG
ncbi:MAG TPA: holo-ACP synthase [Acidimicrobiales bacterium]|nr:holo-ACP synthase [Acidimicrobiales bacterium]